MPSPPRVLTIAGSDPSGGAGIQADLKTFQARGVYGMAIVTALTAQNTCGVRDVHAPPAQFVAQQLDAILDDCPPAATKTGMLLRAEVVRVVAAALRRGGAGRLVVDPVMVATSGDRLLDDDAVDAIRSELLPLADLVTPNVPEAEVLTGAPIRSLEQAARAGRDLLRFGAAAALVKGGHGGGDRAIDVLVTPSGVTHHDLPRVEIAAAHGTGCTLSAALAAGLAGGLALEAAVDAAKGFVHAGLVGAYPVGRGAVPVNHAAGARARGGPDAA